MLPRHSLAWLNEAGWDEAERSAPPEHRDALAAWRREDLPLIARRHEPDLDESWCCLGMALPPEAATRQKTRIPLRVRMQGLEKHMPPLPLASVIPAAPQAWRGTLRQLDDRTRAAGIELRSYGSLALQLITRKRYLTGTSDIDLLLAPSSRDALQSGLALLAAFARDLPLDGEIVFPDQQAVAWKEWLQCARGPAGTRVIAKGPRGVSLRRLDELLATLEVPQSASCP